MLTKIKLEKNAFEYISGELRTGDTYAKHLLNVEHKGEVYTFLPSDLKDDSVNFNKSIYLTTQFRVYGEASKIVGEFIVSFLDKENRISLIETLHDSKSITKMLEPPSANYYQDEAYFALKPREKIGRVLRAFKGARDYPFICGLIDLSGEKFALLENQNIQPEWWNTLAQKTQYIIIGAFDNEGFLIWEVEH